MRVSGHVDLDVVVVGAGVAGMTAAVRMRRPEVVGVRPATVAVIEGGSAGGLLAWKHWRNYHLTGPRYRFRREDWNSILEDARSLGIPIRYETVTGADLRGPVKVIRTESGSVSCRAVVLATGVRPLRNAGDFDHSGGVITAFGTSEHARHAILSFLQSHGGGRPLLWGRENILALASLLGDLPHEIVIEPPYLAVPPDDRARRGIVTRLLGEERLRGVEYRDLEGNLSAVACDCVFVDFNGYMAATHTTDFLAGSGIGLSNGFIAVTEDLASSIDGVYAAGDVTGGMFAVTKALYQGVRAGFSVLRFLHRQRFHEEPGLYPYFHTLREVDVSVFHRAAGTVLSWRKRGEAAVLEVTGVDGACRDLDLPAAAGDLCAWIVDAKRQFDIGEAIAAAHGLAPMVTDRILALMVEAGALRFGPTPAQEGR